MTAGALSEGSDAGRRIVLVHGVGLDRSAWDLVRPILETAGLEVIAGDLPGHAGAIIPSGHITLDELVDAVTPLLGEGAHLVGFSLGALVAIAAALRVPDRVRTLTCVSAAIGRSEAEQEAVAGRLEAARGDLDASFSTAIDRWFAHGFGERRPDLRSQVRAVLAANDPPSYRACYRVFAEADRDLWPRVPEILVPTLAITGRLDAGSTPRMSEGLAAAAPAGRAVIVEDAAHLLPLEQPGALAAAIIEHVRRQGEST